MAPDAALRANAFVDSVCSGNVERYSINRGPLVNVGSVLAVLTACALGACGRATDSGASSMPVELAPAIDSIDGLDQPDVAIESATGVLLVPDPKLLRSRNGRQDSASARMRPGPRRNAPSGRACPFTQTRILERWFSRGWSNRPVETTS